MKPALARLLARLRLLGPDRLRVPVNGQPMKVEVPLFVEEEFGGHKQVRFRVDSACSVSVISLTLARKWNIPTDGTRTRQRRLTALGWVHVEVTETWFRFRLSKDQRAAPFLAPVVFEKDQPAEVPPLLGLKGIINQLRWTFDGRYRFGEPFGFCELCDVRPVARRFPS